MTPQVITSVEDFRNACNSVRAKGKTLALVPTLGALHRAHQALMSKAREHADVLAVSIFVNPTQFAPGEDYERYPRDLSRDVSICADRGAELIFAPSHGEMYRPGATTTVSVAALCEGLCARERPGHFEGVATIVTKLLAVTGPCVAVFGRKDFQQLRVIQRLVEDLLLPVKIVAADIVREPDGLALSSRNQYLTPEQRHQALAIARSLSAVADSFGRGELKPKALKSLATDTLRDAGLVPEYVELVSVDDLSTAVGLVVPEQVGLFIAARLGATRLIDNLILGRDKPPIPLSLQPKVPS